MASNSGSIVKKAIQIDAGNSVKTVKSLKEEIKDLRDQLLNLDKGTQEYEDTQKQLQQDVEDLNTVMNAHKENATALEGSYNDLQNQLKELKAAWKATNDEVERDEIGQKIKEVNDQLKDMDASIGDFHRNVGNYQSSWEGLTNAMSNGEKIVDDLEKGVKAFGTAMGLSDKEVNALSATLKKLKDAFKIAKDISSAKKATEGLSTAQKTAAGTATAMATSNKAAGAATTTMAAAEGTATVATKGLSIAMKGLKAAIISTGIGALIVLLGELIANFDKLKAKLKEILGLQKDIKTQYQQIAELNRAAVTAQMDDVKRRERVEEHRIDMLEAAGAKERDVMVARKENLEHTEQEMIRLYNRLAMEYYAEEQRVYGIKRKKKREEAMEGLKEMEKVMKDFGNELGDFGKKVEDANWDIEVYDEKQKHAAKTTAGATEELKKWADVVKDPKFQAAWTNLMNGVDKEGKSPLQVLNEQYELALKLANKWKVETNEIDNFFKNMISDAEATFQSIQDMENQIYEEGLTPIDRLEQEKAEWIKKYEAWGQETLNITKYYDKKIQEEMDRAAEEALEKQKEAEEKAMAELQNFLSQIDTTLNTEEKLHEMFLPVFAGRTITDEIQYDIDNLQTLYDAQMEYLNGLLETADLTEEEYAAVEDRILSLTVTFNNQMNALKGELDIQGQNVKIFGKEIRGMSKKWIASMSLMEDATASFSDTFQSLGLEDSVAFKGFATAQALISAILAANRVLAEEPGGAIIKGIAAAATLAAGLANVYAIWAVNPDGSNAGNANPQMNVGTSATPVIGNSTPINYTRNITSAAEMDEMNAPIFVKVTDIEDGIEGRRAQVTNSSF